MPQEAAEAAPRRHPHTQAKAYVDPLRFKSALPILEELVRVEPRNAETRRGS